ncbi:hypothetical protein PAMP_020201 [Pampus punctatissimus]
MEKQTLSLDQEPDGKTGAAAACSDLQPSAASEPAQDYVAQTLELKQRLWTALSRPRLQETVMEDGRVEVTEILDLT